MGTLVPPWYKEKPTSQSGLLVAAFFFGASVAIAAVDSTKAGRQSMRSWRRNHRANAYVIMIWAVISMCVVASVCSWLFLLAIIPPSIWYFVGMLFTWVIQIQCLMQILANRLALIMYNPAKERRLKLGLFIIIGLINVSVFCIWVPARLQINPTFIHVNEIWDRIEKALFAIVDMAMNTYFMWLVKSKLVSNGLTQYNLVYKYNLVMACLSVSLDILLIGIMSLPDDAVYVQVHPLAYLTKLSIEMNMADLLGKVVRRSHEANTSLPTTDIWQPHLGMDAFGGEWLGSAKNFVLPPGSRGGGQMHELNLDVLGGKDQGQSSAEGQGASSSGTQGNLESSQSPRKAEGEPAGSGVDGVQDVERRVRGTPGD